MYALSGNTELAAATDHRRWLAAPTGFSTTTDASGGEPKAWLSAPISLVRVDLLLASRDSDSVNDARLPALLTVVG